jgi:hypothetical protein
MRKIKILKLLLNKGGMTYPGLQSMSEPELNELKKYTFKVKSINS